MAGRPVWLASVSYRRPNGVDPIPTARWGPGVRRQAIRLAHAALAGVGDDRYERGFLMCSTLCFHRGASDPEIAALPPGPGGLAGPPFSETIYETPECPPAGLSFAPCDRRTFRRLGSGGLLPVDECGECPSCRARERALAGEVV
jgi:hypothetical protein